MCVRANALKNKQTNKSKGGRREKEKKKKKINTTHYRSGKASFLTSDLVRLLYP